MSWTADPRVEQILARYPDKKSAVMPFLYMAMAEHGYLTDEAIREVSELVGMTSVQVSSIATFYSMYKRERVGSYLISVCTSVSCAILDAADVLHAIEDEAGVPAGETGDDGVFTVEHVECIGACGGAPAVQVNYELIEGVKEDKGRELVRWLRDAAPDTVLGDEMQALFGGQRSFEWGPAEGEGATGPVPALDALGTTGGSS
ncbi:MAG: NAD(P)H-dependent oxidoreductase subunit E [Acidimicrobiia bacterium]|nr:NAD(P)H-dependent oxidoreductase subunit E [Acidimicrobiia bacterium]MBT8217700.1 NAD(P)H-dependent oxidoreductase subunit E [Acidimicrobiia bacterium]NNF10442.1 NAD(P)H-dependent oxidoreductase subunit E [Acidimicrobiia bacterium]NNL69493.1 NAD(P)H-dependent oxidoreductase subunit E [Acidimicrobiia bacterium]